MRRDGRTSATSSRSRAELDSTRSPPPLHRSPEDPEDLINLGITGEERLAHDHLGKDAADRPHVDARRVVTRAEEDFGGAVPEGHDLVRLMWEASAGRERDWEEGEGGLATARRKERVAKGRQQSSSGAAAPAQRKETELTS